MYQQKPFWVLVSPFAVTVMRKGSNYPIAGVSLSPSAEPMTAEALRIIARQSITLMSFKRFFFTVLFSFAVI